MDSTEVAPAADTYPKKILEYMEGFLVSKTLFTACELGVFDVLLAAARPLSAEEISQTVGASLDGTERLLAACSGLQLLETHQHNGQVSYSNTEQASLYLTRSGSATLYHSIQYSSRTIYLCWHYLTDAVRDGTNQYEKAFGVSSKDLFHALYRSDEEMVKFMQLMNSIWNVCGRDVITAFDLSPFKVICDLGGCSGALAKQCTSAYPECTVKIFDLPKVVQTSREHFVKEDDHRISFIEGGAVLLVEALLYENGAGPLTAQLYSLNMLVQTEGRERTGAQYSAMLTAAGFTNIQYRLTGKIYDAVLGLKEA
ncbi:acetylserotonin O-methyltransferase isoform X2 [Dunckerocampus dactyliophorus]|uniref:acetylserotonin O-methyltransferase isoform X2 n=1 Tax=Dunckerocampus dactyliophorus TaxID=161453 RepID=UPI002405ED38|nr:acetylserotonin O-methyltransferase isoform X2 [Dunckerocampus dactyliophorus]